MLWILKYKNWWIFKILYNTLNIYKMTKDKATTKPKSDKKARRRRV
jgi:hypothetical protein